MKKFLIWSIILTLAVLLNNSSIGYAQIDEREEIASLVGKYYEALNSGNLDILNEIILEDITIIRPSIQPITGKDVFLEAFKRNLEKFDYNLEYTIQKISISGDLAYARYFSQPKNSKTKPGNRQKVTTGMFVFKRDAEKKWKIAEYIFVNSWIMK